MIAEGASLIVSCIAAFQPREVVLPLGTFNVDPSTIKVAWIVRSLWLIPAVPMLVAGLIALLKQPRRRTAAALAIGGLGFSLILSLIAFVHVLSEWKLELWALRSWSQGGWAVREVVSFNWIDLGATHLQLGWLLDP